MFMCMYVDIYVFSNISSLLDTPWTIAADDVCMYTCMYMQASMYVFSNISPLLNMPWTIAADMCACIIHDMFMYTCMYIGMCVYVYVCRYLCIFKYQPASQYAINNRCRRVYMYI